MSPLEVIADRHVGLVIYQTIRMLTQTFNMEQSEAKAIVLRAAESMDLKGAYSKLFSRMFTAEQTEEVAAFISSDTGTIFWDKSTEMIPEFEKLGRLLIEHMRELSETKPTHSTPSVEC